MKPCCTDHKGEPKKKYKNREEAEKIAQLRRDEGVGLKLYLCEEGDGWHLTSQNAPPPIRSKNVMTQEERGHYTRQTKNRLGDFIDEDVATQLKEGGGRNTLFLLEQKIEQLQLDIEAKNGIVRKHRRELAVLRNVLNAEERDLKMTKNNLSIAKQEYEIAKRRINT